MEKILEHLVFAPGNTNIVPDGRVVLWFDPDAIGSTSQRRGYHVVIEKRGHDTIYFNTHHRLPAIARWLEAVQSVSSESG